MGTSNHQICRESETAGRKMARSIRGRDQVVRRVLRAAGAAGIVEVGGMALDRYHLEDDDDRLLAVAAVVGLTTDVELVLRSYRRAAAEVHRTAVDIRHETTSVDVYRMMVRVIRRAIRATRHERRQAALRPSEHYYSDSYGAAALRRRAGLVDV